MLRKIGRLTDIKQDQAGLEVPPGQFVTKGFPVLSAGPSPKISLADWQFRVFGLVRDEIVLDWEQFRALPSVTLNAEFHCVTQWSNLHNTWEGVLFNEVMQLIEPAAEARYVMAHCYGGYTTNISLDVLKDDDVLLAYKHDGKDLARDHGAPLRLVVPKRYAWKSAKWLNGFEFIAEDAPGFWEARGYHMEGDPWKEERFS